MAKLDSHMTYDNSEMDEMAFVSIGVTENSSTAGTGKLCKQCKPCGPVACKIYEMAFVSTRGAENSCNQVALETVAHQVAIKSRESEPHKPANKIGFSPGIL
ncbi:hypothetical protein OUZ56_019279 [Daphnia magna]|uniref:Uncharacterized protein n=1 Tax=Daphnia magna TaxID=35525 RepID=A0ABQ9ZB47_9CRUS|nr:hypothetical protein OUZ56_019279 [Daphnia magna]